MTFLEQASLAGEPNFLLRVRQASVAAAVQIQAEDPGATSHTARIAFAQLVLNGTPDVIPRVALAVVTNVSITPQSTDSDLQFTVNSLWNAFAIGVFA